MAKIGNLVPQLKIFRHHKSQKKYEPIIIFNQADLSSHFCPVHYLHRYKSVLFHKSGPFFNLSKVFLAVTYSYVRNGLSKAIVFQGLYPSRYRGHIFRIGAATHASQLGYSESFI